MTYHIYPDLNNLTVEVIQSKPYAILNFLLRELSLFWTPRSAQCKKKMGYSNFTPSDSDVSQTAAGTLAQPSSSDIDANNNIKTQTKVNETLEIQSLADCLVDNLAHYDPLSLRLPPTALHINKVTKWRPSPVFAMPPKPDYPVQCKIPRRRKSKPQSAVETASNPDEPENPKAITIPKTKCFHLECQEWGFPKGRL